MARKAVNLFLVNILIISLLIGCKKEQEQPIGQQQLIKTQTASQAYLKFLISKKKANLGDTVTIKVNSQKFIDSIEIRLNDSLIFSGTDVKDLSLVVNLPKAGNYGLYVFRLVAYSEGIKTYGLQNLEVLPKEAPKQLTYKVVRIYPHDPYAYTQGLVYEDGFLYESTGIKGESSIRKVKLTTGEVVQSHVLPQQYFGEGLTIFDRYLIQLTWQSRIGFVYDKNTFQKIKEFSYGSEGWGLTTDGHHLIMSDGSNKLYFLNPKSYIVEKIIEVYDNKGPVKLLNELEYIKGKIYANIYTKDLIAIINPNNGMVEAYVDMRNILPQSDRNPQTDVLNGIAYDSKNDRIFVTGKNWSKLFEVKFIPQNK